jgi:hypothetical protein
MMVGLSSIKSGAAILALALTSACGTYVPEHQEAKNFDPRRERDAAYDLENAIVQSVNCELRNAVIDSIGRNPKKSTFMQTWAVQMALTLTVSEKTAASPNAFMTFLPSLFTLLFGGSVSAEATRKDTFNFYYTVTDLNDPTQRCPGDFTLDYPHPSGSLLIRSDLKTEEWLFMVLENKVISGSTVDPKNAAQHQVTFVVDTSGNITPGAKLATVTLMPAPPFLSVERKRTHDLLLTFGPADPAQQQGQVLNQNAQQLHQAALFAIALQGTNVRAISP